MILKEFLVSLGLQDNVSKELNKSLKQSDRTISKFVSGFARQFALAGTAVATMTSVALIGVKKFADNLVAADDALTAFPRDRRGQRRRGIPFRL